MQDEVLGMGEGWLTILQGLTRCIFKWSEARTNKKSDVAARMSPGGSARGGGQKLNQKWSPSHR